MAEQVERRFEAAVNVVNSMPKQGSFQPSYESMLKFYGLFKQAREGACKQPKPGFWDVINKAKWEAWSSLGDMARTEAMDCYVNELKQNIQKAPDTAEVAGFSEVLREFYEVVYEVDNEEPPVILRTFKKKTNVVEHPEGKVNGHGSLKETEGKRKKKANKAVNGIGQSAGSEKENVGNTVLPNGLHMEDGPQPLFIVDVKQLKKDRDIDNDSGIHNGDWKVPLSESNGHVTSIDRTSNVTVMSDESEEEEFCDSLDPEHLHGLQNGNAVEMNRESSTEDSPEHVAYPMDTDSSEGEDQTVFTSTPFTKKALHVTFAVDEEEMEEQEEEEPTSNCISVPLESETSQNSCVNGVPVEEEACVKTSRSEEDDLLAPQEPGSGELEGILKPHQAGSGCGGGEVGSRQAFGSRGRNGRGSKSRHQHGTRPAPSMTSSQGRSSGGSRSHSDSDSDDDDDDDHTSRSDYDSCEDETTSRILIALERLQQDMNSILRRLDTIEGTRSSLARSLPGNRSQSWWMQCIPSKTVIFLILWPFLVNLVLRYFRRKKVPSQQR